MGFKRLALLALGALSTGMTLPQAAGPIGYWKLDEAASPSEDSMASADGVWNGAVAASPDVPPQITAAGAIDDCASLRFSAVASAGAVNYVSLGRSATLDASQNGSFTLSAWFKPASIPGGAGSDQQYGIVLKTGLHEGLSLAGTSFVMGHWVGTAPTYHAAGYGAGNVQVGQWYHVAGVVDLDALKVRVYIDGSPPAFNKEADIPAATPAWAGYSNEAWLLGINDPGGGGARYQADGWIDDVRVYGRALLATEIQTLASGGTLGDPVVAPPAAPTGLQATAGTSQITLAWNPVAGASGYNVKRSTVSGAETQHAIATTNSFTDAPLTPGTEYFYVVTALVGCSESSNSVEDSAIPISPIPPPPRTQKLGGESNACGCGSASAGWEAFLAVAAALALLAPALLKR